MSVIRVMWLFPILILYAIIICNANVIVSLHESLSGSCYWYGVMFLLLLVVRNTILELIFCCCISVIWLSPIIDSEQDHKSIVP